MPLSVYVVFLPVWFALSAGLAVGAAGVGSPWGGVILLAVVGYPVALLVATTRSRAAERRGDAAAARRWRLLPLPWVLAMGGFLTWALNT